MGIPTDMFTVMFALGRLPGWIAQWKEMREDGGWPHLPSAPDLHRRDPAVGLKDRQPDPVWMSALRADPRHFTSTGSACSGVAGGSSAFG